MNTGIISKVYIFICMINLIAVYISKPNKASTIEFRVTTVKDLVNVIVPHFDKYPLISKKSIHYLLFKQIVLLMLNQGHHTLQGIQKIVNIRALLNTGLSDGFKEALFFLMESSYYKRSGK